MASLIHYAIPAFVILLVLEAVFSAIRNLDLFENRDTAASLAMGAGNVVVNLAVKAVAFSVFTFLHQFRLFDLGTTWWVWILLFFAEDLSYYVFHRVSHESRFFWAAHVIHHTSERYNLSTALRQTWTGFFGFVFWVWLPLVGFQPVMIMTLQSVSLIYQFWIHTETIRRLGPLEWVLNTPSHHRVHHATNAKYLDRNHAGVLIIWDRLFGTFVEEDPTQKPVYGITRNIKTFNPLRIAFHEWADLLRDIRSAGKLHQKIAYLFKPPGWRHDGVGKTSREIRAAYYAQISSDQTGESNVS